MPRKQPRQLAPAHQCDGDAPDPTDPTRRVRCQNLVATRRPSASGKHFCTRPECQVAKQRFYRQRKIERERLEGQELMLRFIADIVRGEREDCVYCGHEQALVGWIHRNQSGSACNKLGTLGVGLPRGAIDLVNPTRAHLAPNR